MCGRLSVKGSRALYAVVLFLATAICHSCNLLGVEDDASLSGGKGQLRISMASVPDASTRAGEEIPDTSDFILRVCSSSGEVIYDGLYGASPEAIMVDAGSYTISVVSGVFPVPAFSSPLYGDEQCVVVQSGGVADVKLKCCMINCGIRLNVDSEFLTACPDGVLFLRSAQGRLMYGYSERRTAYFMPGEVELVLSTGGHDEVLMTRSLEARQILVLGVSVAPSYSSGSASGADEESISVSVDTSRVWLSDSYVIGGSNNASGDDKVLTVNQMMSSVGEEDVWVSGYVVGGNLTSSSASFDKPFTSRTCLLLGPRSSTRDRQCCVSVQLPSGEVRDALNLVDNPEILGRKVMIRGDVVASYYGLVGLKNCTDYKL